MLTFGAARDFMRCLPGPCRVHWSEAARLNIFSAAAVLAAAGCIAATEVHLARVARAAAAARRGARAKTE